MRNICAMILAIGLILAGCVGYTATQGIKGEIQHHVGKKGEDDIIIKFEKEGPFATQNCTTIRDFIIQYSSNLNLGNISLIRSASCRETKSHILLGIFLQPEDADNPVKTVDRNGTQHLRFELQSQSYNIPIKVVMPSNITAHNGEIIGGLYYNRSVIFTDPTKGVMYTETEKKLENILTIAFVMVNWEKSSEQFLEAVEQQYEFLINSLPSIENCTERVQKEIIIERFILPKINETNENEVFELFQNMSHPYLKRYDYIVGISEDSFFPPNVAGITSQKVAFIQTHSDLILAHEFGHRLGLADEYCDCGELCGSLAYPNFLSKEYGCDPDGSCCDGAVEELLNKVTGSKIGYENCYKKCEGNLNKFNGRSIMSHLTAEGIRYHDDISLRYISRTLKCD